MRVDDKEASEGVALALDQDVVVPGHLLAEIGDERVVESAAQAASLARSVQPREVRILAVHGRTHHLKKEEKGFPSID